MIIGGALNLTQKTVKDAMTPISETFALDINYKLDMYVPHFNLQLVFTSLFLSKIMVFFVLRHTIGLIMSKGHSRIPIYSGSRTNIIGVILVSNSVNLVES